MTPHFHAENTPHFDYPSIPLTFEGYSVRGIKSSIKSTTLISPHDYPSKNTCEGKYFPFISLTSITPHHNPPPTGGGSPSLVVRGNPVRGIRQRSVF